jgi:ABC-type transport system involved in multi-copper enzyme maturation permease subunit
LREGNFVFPFHPKRHEELTLLLLVITGWLSIWLTPIWMLGVGVLLGASILLVCWGVFAVFSPARGAEIPEMVSEGALLPITWVLGLVGLFGIFGAFVAKDVGPILSSAARLASTGTRVYRVPTEPAPDDRAQASPATFKAPFLGKELRKIRVVSPVDATLRSKLQLADKPAVEFEVTGGETKEWYSTDKGGAGFDELNIAELELVNRGDSPAEIEVQVETAPRHPQSAAIPITAITVVIGYLLHAWMRFGAPRTAAIALAACKSQIAQPLFLILIGLGLFLLGLFIFIPYHTFGEDIKVLKDTGLTLIMLFSIFQAVWGASGSVADEIEGKTAMTVLSKPIGRAQFILGKFLGISWASAVLFVVLGLWLVVLVAYKPIYDARETSNVAPVWQETHTEMVKLVPGLLLSFLETLVFVAISVAISTRLPLLANISICFAIYAFGHLVPLLVQAGEGNLETVKFVAQFIATVLPVLDHFNIQAAIATGKGVPLTYLGLAALYCGLYCGMALLLALALFEDRDLA